MSPPTRKLKITVDCSAQWTETLTVEVPENATEEQAAAIAEAAVNGHWFEPDTQDIDADEWEWVGEPKFLPDPPKLMGDPTDAHWFRIGGHRWVTDGWLAVREDSVRPTIKLGNAAADETGWVTHPANDDANLLSGYIAASRHPLASGSLFLPRTLPILEQGELCRAGPNALDPVLVIRGDEVIAVVMPACGSMDEEHVAIRDGRPVLVPAKEDAS